MTTEEELRVSRLMEMYYRDREASIGDREKKITDFLNDLKEYVYKKSL